MHSENKINKTWIEISKKALLQNLHVFQKIVGKKCTVAPVVKANAYGHGLKEVVSILIDEVKVFAVDNINEALIIRRISKEVSIVILGYTMLGNLESVIENDISFVAYNLETLEKAVELNLDKIAKVHIKIETGLNRQGVSKKELANLLEFIKSHKDKIFLEGISTHFANIEDTVDPSFAMEQLKNFKEVELFVHKKGFNLKFIHSAASAGTLLYPETHFSMVRVGIGLYGLWPSTETKLALTLKKKDFVLDPVMTWKSIVAQVKEIEAGQSVGYGRTWYARRKSKIAIIPVGYSDGYDRKLSNIGHVIIGNACAPVVGRVAMNMIMVDVTDIKNVKVEDEVVLLGKKGGITISAEDIAQKIGTINYEVVARINPLLPRVVL